MSDKYVIYYSPPARWGLLDFMSVACSSPPLLSSSSCSTATLDAQCSLSDLNHDHPRPVFPAGLQPRPSTPSVPCRTSTTTIHAQCSLPDLNREYPGPVFPAGPEPRPCPVFAQCSLPDLNREDPCQVFPAGPHVGRYGTKNVQKKVRKNVRQICYILFPTCQVRVVRFYVSCLLLSSSPLLLSSPPPPAQPRPSTHSVLCRTSTTTIHAQCSLPDLNHDHPRPVFPAGPQPRVSTPSVPCRTSCRKIWDKECAEES